MRPQKIRKGWKGILHLPKIVEHNRVYSQRIAISHSMTKVSDACQSGWNKLYGISFGLHHLHSSYRFVFRNRDGKFILGYYAYVDGVSPQENKKLKGEFMFTVEPDIPSGRIFTMTIEEIERHYILSLKNEFTGEVDFVYLPKPKKYKWATWIRTELYPNLKCKQDQVTTFQFLKS